MWSRSTRLEKWAELSYILRKLQNVYSTTDNKTATSKYLTLRLYKIS